MSAVQRKTEQKLCREIAELKSRLEEAEDTLRAIRNGEVDAIVVSGEQGEQVYSLVGAESVYRLIVETMKEAAFTLTFDGKILFCNAQFGLFLKRPLEQIVGRWLEEVVSRDDWPAAKSLLTVGQREPVKQRLVFQGADGAVVPAHVSSNVLNEPDGLSICVVAADLTETERSLEMLQTLRRQQEELQNANEELASMGEELQLQNESLLRATEELNRSNQDLQQFARAISHDLQEPLRSVDGFLKLLAKGYARQLDETARGFINSAVEGAGRMSALVRDLLAYSGLDQKRKAVKPVGAEMMLAAALAGLDASIREAGAQVGHDRLPSLIADGGQLTQLFQNLVGNAIKFRKSDEPCRIHVGVEQREGQLCLFVRDNGIGIAPKDHDRVFQIFQRLHKRADYSGTGIGLAICKKIVERHGGRIWVESASGRGATFYFTLPAAARV